MAKTQSAVVLLAATSGAAGSTRAAPGATGGWIDVRAYYGGEIGWNVTNGVGAPGVSGTILIQQSPDGGTTIFDYHTAAGTSSANDVVTGSVALGKVNYIRVLGFGNTVNPVNFSAVLSATTAL